MTSLVLVTAGWNNPSSSRLLGERLAEASVEALARLEPDGPPAQVTHLELRKLGVDLVGHAATRSPSGTLQQAIDAVLDADGVIAVTPVYNGSYTGLFKLFFDALDEGAMRGRPVLLGATGGTTRHSFVLDHAMLPLFFYLKAPVAPLGVYAATQDWGNTESRLTDRIGRAAAEFADLVKRSSPGKGPGGFDVTDFEDLLRD